MPTRKARKRQAKHALKGSYWAAIAVCFLLAFMAGEYSESVSAIQQKLNLGDPYSIVQEQAGKHGVSLPEQPGEGATPVQQAAARAVAAFTGAVHWLFKMFGGGLYIAAGILMLLFHFFIAQPLLVGGRRFFLVARHTKAEAFELGYALRRGKYLHTVVTMFLRYLYNFLWSLLLVVPGIIKSYEYRMIPYLLAEDATLAPREVFSRSRELMHGHKWALFVQDLSFFGWRLLSAATLGLLGIFFVNPYMTAAEAELYAALRETESTQAEYGALDVEPVRHVHHQPRQFHYRTQYGIWNYILLFFTFSFVGWIWEVGLHLVQYGELVNRGTMFGPWLPIYGSGGVLVLLLLRKLFHKPVLTFFLSMVVCSVIEYASSWYLEFTTGLRWWDYSTYFLNLNGRICLEGALIFGVGCCAAIYFIAPNLARLYDKLPPKPKAIVCVVLVLLFGADAVWSHFHPNAVKGAVEGACVPAITRGISEV